LVPKVEAMLRRLAKIAGIPHVRATDGGSRPLQEYADLKLLEHERMRTLIGPDLAAFANHTLLRAPEGLRHRIGHALLKAGGYRTLDLVAVFLLYLRFAATSTPPDAS
jgi:hypothetical protein